MLLKIFRFLLPVLLSKCALASENTKTIGIGLKFGMNAEYGSGVELALFPTHAVEITGGAGIAATDLNTALGCEEMF